MTLSAIGSSSSSSPSSSSSISSTCPRSDLSISFSSATTNVNPLQNSSLKRKRSSSCTAPPLPDYPLASRPASIELSVKTEEQGHQQEGWQNPKQELFQDQETFQKQEQEQEHHIKQESSKSPPTCSNLLNNVHTAHLPRPSPALIPDSVISSHSPESPPSILSSSRYKDQGTQTDVELPLTETYLNWSGRGRSPFLTPAIAAIDNLKKGAQLVESLERQVVKEQAELEKVIQLRFTSVNAIRRIRYEIVQDRMNPLDTRVALPAPADPFDGKSKSPERLLAKMRISTPPIVDQLFESYTKTLPEQVDNLLSLLMHDLGEGCIPLKYKADLEKKQPQTKHIPTSAFGAMESRSLTSIAMLWKTAQKIVKNALYCVEKGADENTWGQRVVKKILKWETWGPEDEPADPAFSQVYNIASQLLASSCCQRYKGELFETKKTDWALSFSPEHPDVEPEYEALNTEKRAPKLSQMNNELTASLILYSATEIKIPRGNETEARAQLFTWFQAGVSRLRQLLKKVDEGISDPRPTLPLVGWTVTGDRWEFYIAFGDGNNEEDPVIILGPMRPLLCQMVTYFDVFKLLRLIERMKHWARTIYWPLYYSSVIKPLKLINGLPPTEAEIIAEAEDTEERESLSHMS